MFEKLNEKIIKTVLKIIIITLLLKYDTTYLISV